MAEHAELESWESYEEASRILQQAADRLWEASRENVQSDYGLSSEFKAGDLSPEAAMALCEKAMSTLAGSYVEHLSNFQNSEDPVAALTELESAEVTWRTQASVILHLDADGHERSFLSSIRDSALQVLQNKLDEAADLCARKASAENIALCVGILSVMDQIYEENDYSPKGPERLRLRKVIRQFMK